MEQILTEVLITLTTVAVIYWASLALIDRRTARLAELENPFLIQLPISGQWVDPTTILQVHAFQPHVNGMGQRVEPMVVVMTTGNTQIMIDCDSYDGACLVRDRIAAMANGEDVEPLPDVSIPTEPTQPRPATRIRQGKGI